jgi:hypothetical protein
MKILNFTAVEILESLLLKTKAQTIRSAWKKPEFVSEICVNGSPKYDFNGENPIIEKSARYEVGEEIELMWDQRSKFKYLCIKCGKGVKVYSGENYPRRGSCCTDYTGAYKFFPKVFGKAKITEVFKIEMDKNPNSIPNKSAMNFEHLAKRDGFKTSGHMFNWFDEHYNLSCPKPFWVYRLHWVLYTHSLKNNSV